MEIQQSWRMRFSFRNATIIVCFFNLVLALFLLRSFLSSASRHDPAVLRYLSFRESEEIRRSMEPLELMKRVREIEQESYAEPATVPQKVTKQTAAVDLSKRLKDFRSFSDSASIKALEEWRKRKMERARQRELEKNGTFTSQA